MEIGNVQWNYSWQQQKITRLFLPVTIVFVTGQEYMEYFLQNTYNGIHQEEKTNWPICQGHHEQIKEFLTVWSFQAISHETLPLFFENSSYQTLKRFHSDAVTKNTGNDFFTFSYRTVGSVFFSKIPTQWCYRHFYNLSVHLILY